jgi:aminopeptidase N
MNRYGALAAMVAFGAAAGAACGSDEPETTSTSATGAGGSGGGGGSGPSGPFDATVKRYQLSFDLATAQARSSLSIDVGAPGGDCTALPCELQVGEATWNGEPAVSLVGDGSQLTTCGGPTDAGATLELATLQQLSAQTFHGLDVGYSQKLSLAGGLFTYLLSWVGGCDHFGPCDDAPGTLAEFVIEVSHDPATVVLCPGIRTTMAGTTRCEVSSTLAPTYSAYAFAADTSWQRADFVSAAGVDVVFFEAPGGMLASSLDATQVSAFLNWITGLLGPLPYGDELRFAGAPTAWLGFEHPANIVLHHQLPSLNTSYADVTMHVLMHEVVHQWAGDRTTLAESRDFVWKEATAEYLAYVFEDEQGAVGDAAATRAYWDQASLQASYHPRPTDEPAPAVHDFYGDVYGPGPMTLYLQLEALVGRPAVLQAIAAFLEEPGVRSVDELRDALEQSSGESLQAYFDAWVFGSGPPSWPSFSATTDQVADQVTVTLTQAASALFPCAVEVLVQGATQSVTGVVDFGLAPASSSAQTVVTLSEPVVSVQIDPDHRVIDSGGSAAAVSVPIWIF